MGKKEGNGVGQPVEQGASREIGGIEARIEENNGVKGGEWSGTGWRTRDTQGNWRDRD
jgi:hypothetical protein